MEFENITITLRDATLLHLTSNQQPRQVKIDPNQYQVSDVTLICYKIDLIKDNEAVFAYFFKNVNPTSIWYDKQIRDGDRLLTLNGEDVTKISDENIYSSMNEKKVPFTCQVVWHPELYIDLRKSMNKNKQNSSIVSRTQSDTLNEHLHSKTLLGVETYEHLTQIIRYLLDYHPKDPYRLLDQLSKKQSQKEHQLSISNYEDSYSFAQRQRNILSNQSVVESNPEEIMRNILELNAFFEQIGVGLNYEEVYWIWLSMKALLKEKVNIQKLRFWGKIFGIKNNYYIAEADVDTFDEFDLDDSEFRKYQEASIVDEENEIDDESIRKVPAEQIGEGVNQKIFFVSTGIDQPFVQLPLVTPEQIELSRRIQQFFIGDLEAPIGSDFPGVEKHRLRAQIQRISAGTQVGPKNYFKVPATEEEEEIVERMINMIGYQSIVPNILEQQINFDINDEFEENALEDLARSNGQYWAHCVPYIYKQGRTVYFHQRDEDEEIIRSANRKTPVEHNSYILSLIDEDSSINGLYPAWSVGVASTLVPEHSSIYVRSNRWPGAFAVGNRHRFKNLYIGWGVKNFIESMQANMIDVLPKNEYQLEISESDDPTIEEENELFKSSILLSPADDEEFEDTIR